MNPNTTQSDPLFDEYLLKQDPDHTETVDSNYESRASNLLLAELYHENSKNDTLSEAREVEKKWLEMKHSQPRRRGSSLRSLPEPETIDSVDFGNLLRARSSVRSYTPYDITLQELGTLFGHAMGVRGVGEVSQYRRAPANTDMKREIEFRTYPSAGGTYPVEAYWVNMSDNSLEESVYRYIPTEHAVEPIGSLDLDEVVLPKSKEIIDIHDVAGYVLLTGNIWRTVIKYGERGYRYVLMEAGHLMQNMTLVATAIGLDSLVLSAFYDRDVEDALNLDGVDETFLCTVGVGKNDV